MLLHLCGGAFKLLCQLHQHPMLICEGSYYVISLGQQLSCLASSVICLFALLHYMGCMRQ